LPSASTNAWIFVVSPPRDRPIACSPSFLGACCVVMDANHGTVEKNFLEIGVFSQLGEDPFSYAAFLPPCKPLIDAVPGAELLRKVAPRCTRAGYPQNGLDEQAVVCRGTPAIARLARQSVLNAFPLIIAQIQTCHWFTPSDGWAHYIMLNVNTT
jgi:hypothetical protein